MEKGFMVVIGMSIAYVASFLGMALAYWSYRKRRKRGPKEAADNGGGEAPK